MTDLELVQKVKDCDDNDSLVELVNRHTGIFHLVTGKTLIRDNGNDDEILDRKEYLAYKAAKSFDPERGIKFSSWYGNIIRYACLRQNELGAQEPIKVEIEEWNEPISEEKFDRDLLQEVLDYIETLKPRQKKIFKSRYIEGRSLDEIAKEYGVTFQAIQFSCAATLRKIRKKFNSVKC